MGGWAVTGSSSQKESMLKTRLFDYALKIFITMGAVFYVGAPAILGGEEAIVWGYATQELFFRYGVITLFTLSMMIRPKRTLRFYSIPCLLLFSIFCASFFGFGLDLRHKILNFFIGLLFYKLVFENFVFSKVKKYAWWIGWMLMANLAMCSFQAWDRGLIFSHITPQAASKGIDALVGLMRLKVHLGVLSAIVGPFIVGFMPVFTPCLLALLYFGKSSVAIASFLSTCLLLAYFRLKKSLFLLLSVLFFISGSIYVIYFDMPHGQFSERFKVWYAAFDYVLRASPIIGLGIGSFSQVNFGTMQGNQLPILWAWAHNEYLQVFFELGAVGLFLLLVYLVKKHREFIKFKNDRILQVLYSSCLGICLVSFLQFPFHLSRLVGLSIFFFALFHARVFDLKKELA